MTGISTWFGLGNKDASSDDNTVRGEIHIDNTLEQTLDALCVYGKPRLHKMDSGWYCVTECFLYGCKGGNLDVKSDFGKPTALSAALECHERVMNIVNNLSQTVRIG